MKNEEVIIDQKQARLYFYTKMYESGHTPTSFATLFGTSRQNVSLILLGKAQPTKAMREMLGMEDVYRLHPHKAIPTGPLYPDFAKERAELKATAPKKKKRAKS